MKFEPYLKCWHLIADGDPIVTPAAKLLPVVRSGGQPAMLKMSDSLDQQRGAALMQWWDGDGAAQVFERSETALLMERATSERSLSDMARNGDDDAACRILCATAARLHRERGKPLPELVPLNVWFRELEPVAATRGGILARCLDTARMLLADPRETVVLHGDLHHENVLDFGQRGWLAIDPHGLVGERGFDFANIFTNPDLSDPSRPVATHPGCFMRRVAVVADAGRMDRTRLLRWILAWTGLSAAWFLTDEDPLAEIDLTIAQLAAAELDR
ncbi:aminoglycoside phosphotransferase family protein [Mesorhizobium sp. GR13]|uniref:aminoglycoside phosphotransferase family protein n=1 Tax=Mesorhizobium sp. GR13 TaxID=2562308 RepID=UPI0010C074D7|nr:aminoglycoside phosphotransferase family protein [Mesorhizobium sp. GR13]